MEKTVQRAMAVLEALAASKRPRRLQELADELGMSKATLYRHLATLAVLGYVSKRDVTYTPTLKAWLLGAEAARTAGELEPETEKNRRRVVA